MSAQPKLITAELLGAQVWAQWGVVPAAESGRASITLCNKEGAVFRTHDHQRKSPAQLPLSVVCQALWTHLSAGGREPSLSDYAAETVTIARVESSQVDGQAVRVAHHGCIFNSRPADSAELANSG